MEATILEAANQVAGVLTGGCLTVLAAVLLGRTAVGSLRSLRGKMTCAEGWILSYACGAALLSALIFVLCALQLVYDATFLVTFAFIVLCWLRWGRWGWPALADEQGAVPRAWLLLLLVPAAIYGVLYAVHTLAPETRTDAMGYHLGLVQRYYRNHGFTAITTSVYAQISQGAEMLYLFAYSLGRESAAKLVHLSFLIATVAAILCLARRFRAGLAGVFAAVVFCTSPVVIPDATSAYNDCALAFSMFSVFYLLALWWIHRDREWLLLLGIAIGFCFAIKYTGVVAVVAAGVAAAHLLSRGRLAPAFGVLVWTGLPAALIGLPWLIKNAIYTGNPLAPFFNKWFPNPYFSVEWESAYRFAMRSYREGPFNRWEQLLEAPFDLVLGERYAGSLGWMALIIPVALIAWRKPFARALLVAAIVSALPWFTNAGARFLIPSLPFAMLAAGLAFNALPTRPRAAIVAVLLTGQCLSSWPAQRARWYYEDLWSVDGLPWRTALGLEPPKWYLARNVESFLLADRIDKLGGPEARVLSFGNLPEAYFQAELLVSYQALENQDLADAVLAPINELRIPSSAVRVRWPRATIHGVRVRQARTHRARVWAVSEIRVLSNGIPLAPGTGWTARANPLRWHAQRLIDGDIFTAWSSREPPAPGMVIEAQFGEGVMADGMELIHSASAAAAQATLEFNVLESGGRWHKVRSQAVEFAGIDVDPQAARDAAAAMLRHHGIGYVVLIVDPRNPYFRQAQAIASDPTSWSLQKIFVDRSAMLFKVLPKDS